MAQQGMHSLLPVCVNTFKTRYVFKFTGVNPARSYLVTGVLETKCIELLIVVQHCPFKCKQKASRNKHRRHEMNIGHMHVCQQMKTQLWLIYDSPMHEAHPKQAVNTFIAFVFRHDSHS